jgi:hypothetical protein
MSRRLPFGMPGRGDAPLLDDRTRALLGGQAAAGPRRRARPHDQRTGRNVMPTRPALPVGDARVPISPGSSRAAAALLARLRPRAVADGTLRFDTRGALTGRLTTARVRLFIVDRLLVLTPQFGSAVAPG